MTLPLPSADHLQRAAAALPALPAPAEVREGKWAVAFSGGADSVYALAALWANPQVRPRLVAWHFDHGTRGAASTSDAAFCAAFCEALQIPFVLGSRATKGMSSENDLRTARQAFFAEQRERAGVRLMITAHHVDDLVETMLWRLARGAGPAGLAAPRVWQVFRDGHVHWRPLVAAGLTKAHLRAELQRVGLPWCEDATNAEPITVRNRIRHWLATGGAEALGEHFQAGFARSAQLQDDYHQALLVWAQHLGVNPAAAECGVQSLVRTPRALVYTVVFQFLQAQGFGEVSAVSLKPLVEAIQAGEDTQLSVQGQLVQVRQGCLRVVKASSSAWGQELTVLNPNETCEVSGLTATAVVVDAALWAKLSRGDISPQAEVYLKVPAGTVVAWRRRREGDRYQALGAPGSALLADMLINRKIPVAQRDSLPVVLAAGQILWVPGLPPAEAYRLEGPGLGALRLTWRAPCLS